MIMSERLENLINATISAETTLYEGKYTNGSYSSMSGAYAQKIQAKIRTELYEMMKEAIREEVKADVIDQLLAQLAMHVK